MRAILYKDRNQIIHISLLMAALAVLMFVVLDLEKMIVVPAMILVIPLQLNALLFSYDPLMNPYLKASPLRSGTIVAGRYMVSWVNALLGIIISVLYMVFAINLQADSILLVLCHLPLLYTLIPCIQNPIAYLVNPRWVQIASTVLYIAIFISAQTVRIDLDDLSLFFQDYARLPRAAICLIPLALALVLNAVSYFLSVRIYAKKEC